MRLHWRVTCIFVFALKRGLAQKHETSTGSQFVFIPGKMGILVVYWARVVWFEPKVVFFSLTRNFIISRDIDFVCMMFVIFFFKKKLDRIGSSIDNE